MLNFFFLKERKLIFRGRLHNFYFPYLFFLLISAYFLYFNTHRQEGLYEQARFMNHQQTARNNMTEKVYIISDVEICILFFAKRLNSKILQWINRLKIYKYTMLCASFGSSFFTVDSIRYRVRAQACTILYYIIQSSCRFSCGAFFCLLFFFFWIFVASPPPLGQRHRERTSTVLPRSQRWSRYYIPRNKPYGNQECWRGMPRRCSSGLLQSAPLFEALIIRLHLEVAWNGTGTPRCANFAAKDFIFCSFTIVRYVYVRCIKKFFASRLFLKF